MKYPDENTFLKAIRDVEDHLQCARVAHGRLAYGDTVYAPAHSHAYLEAAHDSLVTLLGMFADEPQPAALDMCQVAEML